MAAFVNGVSRHLLRLDSIHVKSLLETTSFNVTSKRSNFFFRHLSKNKEHNETNYDYEVTNNPKDWEYVERLLPMETVPEPTPKSHYPSGWRPMKEESLQLPYFVERSKNHMLSVYLKNRNRGIAKVTKVCKIHGDLWVLHNELKSHLEKETKRPIASYVLEGSNSIYFRGDFVYHVEQWMLKKGF